MLVQVQSAAKQVLALPKRPYSLFKRGTYEVLFQLAHLCGDLLVARSITQSAAGGFKAVERALPRQGLSAISYIPSGLAFQILLATKQSYEGIGSKQIMIIEIFVSETQSVRALRDQFIDAVLDELGVTQIRKALREPLNEPLTFLDLTQKKATRI